MYRPLLSFGSLLAILLLLLANQVDQSLAEGILYPQESEKRELNSLDGLWNFRAANRSNQQQGFDQQWYLKPLRQVLLHYYYYYSRRSNDHRIYFSLLLC